MRSQIKKEKKDANFSFMEIFTTKQYYMLVFDGVLVHPQPTTHTLN